MVMGGSASEGGGRNTAPVEQVLMFPSGTVALSSAGPILRVWDLVAGGRCTRALSNHQKTVTALAFDSKASRLLTGGLDQMVKVYDVATYKVVHTMRYPAPILCLAVSVRLTNYHEGEITLMVCESLMRRILLRECQTAHCLCVADNLRHLNPLPKTCCLLQHSAQARTTRS